MKVGTLLEELSQFDYDDNLVLYFLKNDELKPCKLESIIDANYEDDEGYTKWYVLHAEANAIAKVSSSTQSTKGATLYITLSPCRECSKLIFQSGIKRVVYNKKYKDTSGLEFLEKAGVETCFVSI